MLKIKSKHTANNSLSSEKASLPPGGKLSLLSLSNKADIKIAKTKPLDNNVRVEAALTEKHFRHLITLTEKSKYFSVIFTVKLFFPPQKLSAVYK